jgi:hypothetical protein
MRQSKEFIDELCKALTDKGQLIEAGWRSYELIVLDEHASDIQRKETRIAFFAGAQHLYSSIMSILEPGTEPTGNDLHRMAQIHEELEKFEKELRLRATPAEGNA